MNILKNFIEAIRFGIRGLRNRYFRRPKYNWGKIGKKSFISSPSIISGKENIYLGDNCNIDWNNTLYCTNAKFIMGNNSGAAVGLTVVTGNHRRAIGVQKGELPKNSDLEGRDIVVGEDVWIAANVTLLAGAKIGRGAIIGAGSVVRSCSIPPYAIVLGNPAKVVGFRYLPEEIIEHEKIIYNECERLDYDTLKKNYNKFFIKRIKEIKEFTKI